MKALDFFEHIVEENFSVDYQNFIINRQSTLKNILITLVRKFTSQAMRIRMQQKTYWNKIFYNAKNRAIDYLIYTYRKNPDIPFDLFPKKDKREILYFLKMMYLSVIFESFEKKDFEGRWEVFEEARKKVGQNLKFNPFTNTYNLYGFQSVVYPDTGVFPDNFKLSILKKKEYKVCFDLGAYIGDSSYILHKELSPDKIYAFEPEKKLYKILKDNLKLNRLTHIVEPVRVALSNYNGFGEFSSEGAVSTFSSSKTNSKKNRVKVMTMDTFVQKNKIKKVDLIKMDIEGAEFDVLKGAVYTIKRNKPDLLIAIYHVGEHFFEIPLWLRKIVSEYNFRFVALDGVSPITERYVYASVEGI